jgi:DNA modification methylase
MDVKDLPVETLIEYGFNNRLHGEQQVDRIANSIRDFGFNQPVVVDEDNIILVGHGRVAAAKKLGLDTVPVLKRKGLTESQKRAYRILDNKLQNDSEWNFENLKLELDRLTEDNYPIEDWGLTDLSVLMPEPEQQVHEDDFDADVTLRNETFIKRGDLIELGIHRLLCGDSTEGSDVETLMDGQKADMMFTDPPYGVAYTGGHFHSGDVKVKRERESLANDGDASIYRRFLSVCIRYVDGPCYTWFAGTKAYDVCGAIEGLSGEIHSLLIWHKTNATYAAMSAHYKQRHEPCLYWKPKGSTLRWCGPSNASTLWEFPRDASNNFHPTQKPVILAATAMKNHDAGLIVDFFLGSGSTLIAAEQLGRKCFGMELSPNYCEVILKRYAAHVAKSGRRPIIKVNGMDIDPDKLSI